MQEAGWEAEARARGAREYGCEEARWRTAGGRAIVLCVSRQEEEAGGGSLYSQRE